MFNFAILLDTCVLILFFYFVMESARQGLIANVIGLLRYVVSYFVALALSERCSQYVYHQIIKGSLEGTISGWLEKFGSAFIPASEAQSFEIKIDELKKRTEFLELGDFWDKFSYLDPKVILRNLANAAIYPVIKSIMGTLLFFVALKLCRIVARQLMRAARGINRIPILGGLNGLLGFLFGFVKAAIVTLILSGMAGMVIVVSANELSWLNTQIVAKTHLARFFFEASSLVSLKLPS